jgi:hypothetical protein
MKVKIEIKYEKYKMLQLPMVLPFFLHSPYGSNISVLNQAPCCLLCELWRAPLCPAYACPGLETLGGLWTLLIRWRS